MTILLNNVYATFLEQGIINTDQALYLIQLHREITLSYKGKKNCFSCTAQSHIVGNKIGKEIAD
jgi:hypothetical protein